MFTGQPVYPGQQMYAVPGAVTTLPSRVSYVTSGAEIPGGMAAPAVAYPQMAPQIYAPSAMVSPGMQTQTRVVTLSVSEAEVLLAQKAWSDAIKHISKTYLEGGDYVAAAAKAAGELYGYDGSKTKVEYTFGYKKNADGKVRIFLHHSSVPYSVPAATASGAITEEEVKSVQAAWANAIRSISKTYLDGGDYVAAAAKAAGELYGYDGSKTKVEYTFGYKKNADGKVRIFLHHSSVPYSVPAATASGAITEEEVKSVQAAWANAIRSISKTYLDGGDYVAAAAKAAGELYGYDGSKTKVEYTFGYKKNADGKTKVEYTFGYKKNADGKDLVMALCFPVDGGRIVRRSFSKAWTWAGAVTTFPSRVSYVTSGAEIPGGMAAPAGVAYPQMAPQIYAPSAMVSPGMQTQARVVTLSVSEAEVLLAQKAWSDAIKHISKTYLEGGDYVAAAAKAAGELYGYGHSDVLFKPTKAAETKVEYTFGYKKNADGKVRIFLHHSSVPYSVPAATASGAITEEEVKSVQAAWANAIRSISKTYLDGGDYVAAAAKAAGELYGYGHTNVLFKPTKTKVEYTFGYKKNADGKVRIFLHHSSVPYSVPAATASGITEEEVKSVQAAWANAIRSISKTYLDGGDYVAAAAKAAGELYGYGHTNVLFKPTKTKVEYTFGYKKNADGKVRIFLHHSSVPYSVPAATASGAITEEEVKSVQAAWANAIKSISKTYLEGGDYVAAAAKAASELYGYGHTNVLFKPTKAAEDLVKVLCFPVDGGRIVRRSFSKVWTWAGAVTTLPSRVSYVTSGAEIPGGMAAPAVAYPQMAPQIYALSAMVSPGMQTQTRVVTLSVSEAEVLLAQKAWSDAIKHISKTYLEGGDYVAAAAKAAGELYGYDGSKTKVEYTFGYKKNADGKVRIFLHHSSVPYRVPAATASGAITEEEVKSVQAAWANAIKSISKTCLEGGDYVTAAAKAAGELYGYDGSKTKVEYTFGYKKNADGKVRIFLHHSSVPYSVPAATPTAEITEEEVKSVQAAWANAIKSISKTYLDGGDYIAAAAKAAGELYGYDGSKTKVEYTFGYKKNADGKVRIFLHRSSVPYSVPAATASGAITEEEVKSVQAAWANAIRSISKTYLDGGDCVAAAAKAAGELYGYGHTNVLFKPTKTKVEYTFGYKKNADGKDLVKVLCFPVDGGRIVRRSFSKAWTWAGAVTTLPSRVSYVTSGAEIPGGMAAPAVAYPQMAPQIYAPSAMVSPRMQTQTRVVTLSVSEAEVLLAQKAWSDAIKHISKTYLEGGDYVAAAAKAAGELYGYDGSKTKVEYTFGYKKNADGKVRIFLHHSSVPYSVPAATASGAITEEEVKSVQAAWANAIRSISKTYLEGGDYVAAAAKAAGELYGYDGSKTKVEYTFGYKKNADGKVRIFLHHSSVPYSVPAATASGAITEEEVKSVQAAWANAIKSISKTYLEGGDYVAAAAKAAGELYGYDGSKTKVEYTFGYKKNADGKVRIFLHHSSVPYSVPAATASGAITEEEVKSVQAAWANAIKSISKTYLEGGDYVAAAAKAAGELYGYDGSKTKVEYTFGYKKNADGKDLVKVLCFPVDGGRIVRRSFSKAWTWAGAVTTLPSRVSYVTSGAEIPGGMAAPAVAYPQMAPQIYAPSAMVSPGMQTQTRVVTLSVSEAEVLLAQKAWSDAIKHISKTYLEGGDYVAAAAKAAGELYGYDGSKTKVEYTFGYKKNADGKVRIFLHHSSVPYSVPAATASGAITEEEVKSVQAAWANAIKSISKTYLDGGDYVAAAAKAAGELYGYDGSKTKVEYTFGYKKNADGKVRIFLHHSSVPYSVPAATPTAEITEEEVKSVQAAWANAIKSISKTYLDGGDYVAAAGKAAGELYGYDGSKTKVEYTFGYKKNADGKVRIFLHHSSVPYSVPAATASGAITEEEVKSVQAAWANAIRSISKTYLDGGDYVAAAAKAAGELYGYDGSKTKVEYTFGYKKNADGKARALQPSSQYIPVLCLETLAAFRNRPPQKLHLESNLESLCLFSEARSGEGPVLSSGWWTDCAKELFKGLDVGRMG
ncbi:unnamed protein product [Cladocopium goreaui]|uniref:Stress-activated protein kinase JNK n=1 Tax=Cladocopium goreaui TaxID=2562237 RepID=A0A9P1C2W5_9DINO|nr:unnamed protein product [Cladocopium goreaui]